MFFNFQTIVFICLGVFCYNYTKYMENRAKESIPMIISKPQAKPLWENHYTLDQKVWFSFNIKINKVSN